ncbi:MULTISPECIES: DUF6126 family protein [Streptomycetaceae]|uniref:Uncharacterized protein n=1 Tax=Streptantibioticus cattleyicolor (strain ATCC 35852 / DSM 46488 / JCM 4925 / NBRC 14057 / NRRL 8057) TaxID=1003195 RepID=F8JRP8_STREN
MTGAAPRGALPAPEDEKVTEKAKERGVLLRVFVYVFATHLFAGFVWLLFHLGGHRM